MTLRCRLGIHHLDRACICTRCGSERHRVRTRVEWVLESGIDTTYGIWWDYDEAGYTIAECDRCGRRQSRSLEPTHFRQR